jgi:hypothetical protein
MVVFWDIQPCIHAKMDVSEVPTTPIITCRLMEAVGTFQTVVNLYQSIWSNDPENSHLQTYRRENLKIHVYYCCM